MSIGDLQREEINLAAQIASLEAQGTFDAGQYSKIVAELTRVREEIVALQENEQKISEVKAEYNGGLKEVLFQVFEATIPSEVGQKHFGINEFQELGELFRQMVSIAVDDNDSTLNTYISQLLEEKDAKIRELASKSIEAEGRLQEAIRKEQYATENYERSAKENELYEQKIVTLENAIADKDVAIGDLYEQLKAKDEQISKLNEEMNKPNVPSIILPNQARPSASLQQLMDDTKNKAIKSQKELLLSGSLGYRGKVEITAPPLGGSNDTVSFPSETAAAESRDNQVPHSEVEVTPTPTTADGLVGDETISEGNETVTRAEFEALAARVTLLEQQKAGVAA